MHPFNHHTHGQSLHPMLATVSKLEPTYPDI
jgi:hypothetical protein